MRIIMRFKPAEHGNCLTYCDEDRNVAICYPYYEDIMNSS